MTDPLPEADAARLPADLVERFAVLINEVIFTGAGGAGCCDDDDRRDARSLLGAMTPDDALELARALGALREQTTRFGPLGSGSITRHRWVSAWGES